MKKLFILILMASMASCEMVSTIDPPRDPKPFVDPPRDPKP